MVARVPGMVLGWLLGYPGWLLGCFYTVARAVARVPGVLLKCCCPVVRYSGQLLGYPGGLLGCC